MVKEHITLIYIENVGETFLVMSTDGDCNIGKLCHSSKFQLSMDIVGGILK